MRESRLPFGQETLPLHLPDGMVVQEIEAKCIEPGKTEQEIVREALEHPIGSPSLKELTRSAKKILIITDDNTRPMPSRITLPLILNSFDRPADQYEVTILIATGLHRSMTSQEQEEQLGEEICRNYRVLNHNARDGGQLISLGKMSTGNELVVNRVLKEQDLILAEGFIEAHFFAGFSGGRKSILPGVSGEATILRNHNPHNIADRHSRGACLEGNLIHQECCEAARLAGLGFILNVALNERKQIVAAFAGDPAEAHERGCEYVKNTMSVPVRRTDIVITTNNGYPLDRNLYQVVKGIEVAGQAVKKGGVIVIAAECRDGIGHEGFSRLLASCCSPEELYEKMSAYPVEVDKWQVQILARVLKDTHVILVNRSIDTEVLKSIFLEQAPDLDAGLAMAMRLTGPEAAVSIMPEGPVMIPVAED